jgi:hypothetical protein
LKHGAESRGVNTSKRGKAKGGSAGGPWVTPPPSVRIFRVRKSLEPRRRFDDFSSLESEVDEERHEGQGRRETVLATGKGKPP